MYLGKNQVICPNQPTVVVHTTRDSKQVNQLIEITFKSTANIKVRKWTKIEETEFKNKVNRREEKIWWWFII